MFESVEDLKRIFGGKSERASSSVSSSSSGGSLHADTDTDPSFSKVVDRSVVAAKLEKKRKAGALKLKFPEHIRRAVLRPQEPCGPAATLRSLNI